jgi:transposase
VKSFFALLRKRAKYNSFDRPIHFPHFLKKDSHYVLIYTKQYIRIKDNKIYLCLSKYLTDKYKTKLIIDLPDYIKDNEIKEIRIIPRNKYFDLHIVYKKEELKEKSNNESFIREITESGAVIVPIKIRLKALSSADFL